MHVGFLYGALVEAVVQGLVILEDMTMDAKSFGVEGTPFHPFDTNLSFLFLLQRVVHQTDVKISQGDLV